MEMGMKMDMEWNEVISRWANEPAMMDVFAEAPLLSATSSLNSHLSALLLLWAASPLVLLWLLQPSSSLRAAVTSITHALLRAAVPMRFVTASCKAAYQQRHTKATNISGFCKTMLRPSFPFLREIQLALRSGAHFANRIFQKWREILSLWQFWYADWALAAVWNACSRQLSKIEASNCGNRDHTLAT